MSHKQWPMHHNDTLDGELEERTGSNREEEAKRSAEDW